MCHFNVSYSFECLLDEENDAVAAVQHCWNVIQGNQCVISGLIPGLTYRYLWQSYRNLPLKFLM